ncbi:GNAT family N-acetyltransferase [Aquimarina muelleri]|uniref:N-acetyltransferase YoaA n=1 Tax=Aquimarina muelleri TaxID=279356 RepID=A0A918JWR7_9FLAO|nr:GNAT family N-acetyltransferase [Aquimarina muelleri]MCX2763598.1 GNAT family N-acetyltransferase [Aquimarina muelleri]GGX14670.1 putative N-acetyltransferase YoaA [Aquimarina muelleri]
MNFIPFPNLQTDRLLLRQLKKEDANSILFLRSDAIVNKYVKRPKTDTVQDAIDFINKINNGIIEHDWIFWGITINGNPDLIGTICLWNFSEDQKIAEIGYDLHPEFHKKGIMNEALNSILNYGYKSLNLEIVEAYTHKNNEASKNLLFNNGFHLIEHKIDKDNLDNIIFALELF